MLSKLPFVLQFLVISTTLPHSSEVCWHHLFSPPFIVPSPLLQELRHQSNLPQDESRADLMRWAREGFPEAVEDDMVPTGMRAQALGFRTV